MTTYPVHVRARPDAPGRWLWLIKWLLLIPHYIVLVVLWVAFIAMTIAGYVAVLFTGRFPRGIFDFNVGVLRWTWRVGYYGYQVLGTDRYPPFTLAQDPAYPADLYIEHPDRLPRYQPLVAWLLALPHAVLLGAIGGTSWQVYQNGSWVAQTQISLVGAAVLIAGIGLAATGKYPRGLYDLLTGVARWSLRVIAYVTLLTGRYPPFRLDQGGDEPVDPDARPPAGTGTVSPWISPAAPLPPPPPSTPGPAATAARVVALAAGVLLMLTGLVVGLGGGVLLAVDATRDTDGYATSSALTLATPTAAVTSPAMTIEGTDTWRLRRGDFGKVRVTASGQGGTPLFLGVGRASDVDRWLSGTTRDELTQAWDQSDAPAYRRAGGDLRPLNAPGDQTFWVSEVSGAGTIQLNWDTLASNGDYVFVLANADGSLSVAAETQLGVNVPALVPLGGGLLLTAGVFILVGFALVYGGASGLGRHHGGPPAPAVGPTPPMGPAGTTTAEPPVGTAATTAGAGP